MNFTVEMLNTELCMGCGICKGVCMLNAIQYERNDMGQYLPVINKEKCNECGNCYTVCPGKGIEEKTLYKNMGQELPQDEIMGNVVECYNAKINDVELRKKCTSGGMVTDIIQFMLKEGIYDVAFCVEDDNFESQVFTKPQYANSDFSKTAQSRYVAIAHSDMIKYILENRDKRVIIVGTGCVMAGVRNVIHRYKLNSDNYLLLGLFCAMSLNYNTYDYMKLFSKKKLIKCEFRSKENGIYKYGNVKLIYDDGSSKFLHSIQRGYLKQYMVLERCFYCMDLLATFADIAFGDNNTVSADGDSTTVIVRTATGQKVMQIYPGLRYQKEDISQENICRKGTLKDRKKNKHYIDIYEKAHKIELYPDRKKDVVDQNELEKHRNELEKKLKDKKWGSKKQNLKKLFLLLQLKMLRLRIFRKDLLKPIER